jgi:hypothetical protein
MKLKLLISILFLGSMALLSTQDWADTCSSTGSKGASVAAGYSYIGFPGNATNNTPDTPDTTWNRTADYSLARQQTGIAGTAHRIRVYFGTNITGTFTVIFYKNGHLTGEASITPSANSWVYSSVIGAHTGHTSADLIFTGSDTVQMGVAVTGGTISYDVMYDANAGSFYYVGEYQSNLITSYEDLSASRDLACILEY